MALVVTPGAADADGFVSVAACETYCAAKGLTDWTSAPDSPSDDKDAAIRRATTYLSTAFAWKGYRTNRRAQALAWPRADVVDGEGEDVREDEIPVEIEQACCELAVLELVEPGILAPTVRLTERVKSESVGPLSTEYFGAPMNAREARPAVLLVREMVAGLVNSSSNALVGVSVRA
jgi:hypothetical protein